MLEQAIVSLSCVDSCRIGVSMSNSISIDLYDYCIIPRSDTQFEYIT